MSGKRILKHLAIIFLFITAIITISGCNGKKGSNVKYETKHKYENGTYYAFSEYFDENANAPFIKITIKHSIITRVDFNYVNKKDKLLYKSTNNSSDRYYFIKSLNTQVLQQQGMISDTDEKYNITFYDYSSLLSKVLQNAKKGTKHNEYVNLDKTYSAKLKGYDSYGYNASLQVTYKNGKVSDIVLKKENKDGQSINGNEKFIADFKESRNESLERYINDIARQTIGKSSIELSSNDTIIDKQFNMLAKIINNKRTKFNYKKYKAYKKL